MGTPMSSGFLPTETVGIIDLINHFDKLLSIAFPLDILNSSSLNNKEYGKAFIENDKQIQFLEEMLYFINSIFVIFHKFYLLKL